MLSVLPGPPHSNYENPVRTPLPRRGCLLNARVDGSYPPPQSVSRRVVAPPVFIFPFSSPIASDG